MPTATTTGAPAVRLDGDAWVYWKDGARIKALETPMGTKGYRDLRRRAARVHLGGGLRPPVAAPGTWCG